MKILKQRAKVPSWLRPFRDELQKNEKPGEYIGKLQGSAFAEILMCVPVPTKTELNENRCWSNERAVTFFDLMAAHTGLTPESFLMVPPCFNGKSPCKTNVHFSLLIVNTALRQEQIRKVVCVGRVAYKVFFGYGRFPQKALLHGAITYPAQTGYKPLFVFPELDNLFITVSKPNDRFLYARAQREMMDARTTLDNLLGSKFKQFLAI